MRREPYKRLLIVCEGSKTELLYFEGIKDRYRLRAANVRVTSKGTAPTSVVKRASELQERERKLGEEYDDALICIHEPRQDR